MVTGGVWWCGAVVPWVLYDTIMVRPSSKPINTARCFKHHHHKTGILQAWASSMNLVVVVVAQVMVVVMVLGVLVFAGGGCKLG